MNPIIWVVFTLLALDAIRRSYGRIKPDRSMVNSESWRETSPAIAHVAIAGIFLFRHEDGDVTASRPGWPAPALAR
ncbi:KPN_01571 family protein [Salmonella enterica subsp. enterica serovar Enteritidis]